MVEIVKVGRFQKNKIRWLCPIFQIMHENYYHEELAKISTCVKCSIDAYHRYIFPRYTVLFRELKFTWLSWWYPQCYVSPVSYLIPSVFTGDSACFPRCFCGYLGCFSCFPALFSAFPNLDFAENHLLTCVMTSCFCLFLLL